MNPFPKAYFPCDYVERIISGNLLFFNESMIEIGDYLQHKFLWNMNIHSQDKNLAMLLQCLDQKIVIDVLYSYRHFVVKEYIFV